MAEPQPMFHVRFTDRDGATWETVDADSARCLNDPTEDPDSWEPGVPVPLAEVQGHCGPLEFVECRPASA